MQVMIRCPHSRRSVFTGVTTDAWPRLVESLRGAQRMTCPDCGSTHRWHLAEAFVADSTTGWLDLAPHRAAGLAAASPGAGRAPGGRKIVR